MHENEKHSVRVLLSGILLLVLSACGPGGDPFAADGEGSGYPEKMITIVAPSGAGGGWDLTARSLAKVLAESKLVDQPITVENKPGGGGAVFMAEYATADKNNPYKLFVNSPPLLINNLKKEGNSPYGFRDTTPLAQLTRDYGAIVVQKSSKYRDIRSLVDDLKKDPKHVTLAGRLRSRLHGPSDRRSARLQIGDRSEKTEIRLL